MATYNGTNGDDVINATAGSNTINAGNGNNRVSATGTGSQNVTAGTGNDTITTGDGSDTINAGAGNNVVNAGNGNNNVTTLNGNDTITAGSGNDTINAGDGRNIVDAGGGQNNVTTGSGDDEIRTGAGNDQINAGDGANLVLAGEGNNNVSGGSGNDTISTGAGNDQINAGNGNNVVDAGSGNNNVTAGTGDDRITSGSGNDVINAGDGRNVIDAGDGQNQVNTGRGDDTIDTGSGYDWINAGDGRNIIDAGAGKNWVNTGSGADDITTGNDDDTINAGDGVNVIRAGDGDNDITSGSGADTITAGSGNDEIHAGEGNNVIDAGNGNNAVTAGSGNDQITTGSGNDAIYAGEGQNVVNAGNGNNAVYTGSGNDQIITGSGSDAIYAGEGNDFVDAGGGSDVVYLDGGNDTYRYVMSQHGNTVDVAWGGSGNDTLQLVLTAEQARNATVLSDIQRFNTDANGNGLWGWVFGFQFKAFNLSIRDFEAIDIVAPVDARDDAATVSEDGAVNIAVLANDEDLGEADLSALRVLSYDAAGVPGTLTLNNNVFSFVPGAAYQNLAVGQTATVTFTYTLGDDQGYTDTATVTLTITGANDGPVAVADIAATTENQSVTVDVLANDTDVDNGAVLTLVSAAAPVGHGTASVVNNKLVFAPGTNFDHLAAGATEVVNVTYTMKDQFGATSTATVAVTVTGTNDGPVAVADTAAGTENQTLTVNVLANDTDLDDGHVFTLVSAAAPTGKGSAAVVNNQLVFTPGAAFDHLKAGAVETVTLVYTMRDDQGATASSTVTVIITGTNDGPIAVADTAATAENQAVTVNVLANDIDVDDAHVFTLLSAVAPAGKGVATVAGNNLVFTPGADFDHLKAGATELVTVTYVMRDDQGAQSIATATITVTGTNDAPVVSSGTAAALGSVVEAGQAAEGAIVAGTPVAQGALTSADVDDGATATWTGSANGTYGSFAIGANGQWTYTLDNGRAATQHLTVGQTVTETFLATVTDDQGASATQLVTVTVTGTNDNPVITSTAAAAAGAVIEAGVATAGTSGTSGQLVASDIDDGGTSWSGTANGTYGAFQMAGNGSWNYALDNARASTQALAAGQVVTETFDAVVTDLAGGRTHQTVTVTITGSNDGPVVTSSAAAASGAVVEAGDAGAGTPVATGLLSSSDVDANATAAWSGSANGTYGSFAIGTNGAWTYTLDNARAATQGLRAGQQAVETFLATVTDDQGATATQLVTVSLTGSNDGPVIVTADLAVEGAVVEAGVATAGVPSASGTLVATDVDDAIAWSGSSAGTYGSFVIGADGAWTYTIDNNASVVQALAAGSQVSETFTAIVTDAFGATQTRAITVTVTGSNDGPVAVADVAAIAENQSITVDVLANDTDVDAGHVFTLVSAAAPANKGVASVVGNQLVFTPGTAFDHLALGVSEVVTVSYVMRDDQGAESVSTATITVTGTNDVPVAVADAAAATENQALTVDVLANDTDVDDAHVFTLLGAAAPAGKGSAAIVGNALVFTPGTDFDHLAAGGTEVVTISYLMADENGAQSASTLTVTVTGTNDAPMAVADVAAITENQAIAVDVLANDTDVDDGHVFTLVNATAPAGKGAASVVNNQLVFAPGSDFDHLALGATEVVTVAYAMRDDQGAESVSSLTVTVTGTNDAPVAVADTAAGTENQQLTIDVLANDTDVDDGHSFTLLGAGAPAGKGLAAVVNNKLVFAPGSDFDHLAAGATETVTLVYTMRDENGAPSSSTVAVTVTGTNDAPVAGFDAATATENQTLAIDVLANDTDVDDGAALTVTAAFVQPGQGSATIVNNQVVFNPGADFDHLNVGDAATVTIFYVVRDDRGAQSAATVTLTVNGTNDVPVARVDTAAGTENQVLTVDVLANDSDVDDGAVLTLASVSAPAGKGTAAVVDGKLVFTPGTDFDHLAVGATEVVTLSYAINDEHGATATSALTITITGTNDAPVASADLGSVFEGSTLTGSVAGNDIDVDDGAVLSFALDAPVAGLTLSSNGSYSFNAGNPAYDALAAGEQQIVVASYTVSDQHGATSSATLTITLTGTNDAPVVTSTAAAASGSVVEAGNNDDGSVLAGTPTASGTLSSSDVDHGATAVWSGSRTSSYGTFAIGAAGNWTYTLANGNLLTQRLREGESVTDQFLATVTDDKGATSTQTVSVTLIGTNDAPVVTSTPVNAVGTVSEAGNTDSGATVPGTASAIGVLSASDVDGSSRAWSGSTAGTYGDFAITGAGVWTYTLDNSRAGTQALAEGQSVTDTFTATVTDEFGGTATQVVTVTVNGTNDSPVVTSTAAAASGSVVEAGNNDDGSAFAGTPSATGQLASSDVDAGATATWSGTANGTYGTFAIGANGQWTYTLDNSRPAVNVLSEGQSVVETFVATVTDNKGAVAHQQVTVTVNGGNDAPTLEVQAADLRVMNFDATMSSNGYNLVSEDGLRIYTPDHFHYEDVDGDGYAEPWHHYYAEITSDNGGKFSLAELDVRAPSGYGVGLVEFVAYSYDSYGNLVQVGSQSFSTSDGHVTLSSIFQNVDKVVWNYQNSYAVLDNIKFALGSAAGSSSIAEIADNAAGENVAIHSAAGALTFADVDLLDTHTATAVANGAGYVGTFTVIADDATDKANWTFSVADSAIDNLAAGEVVTQSYLVTLTDNHGASAQQVVTVTLTGANDAPVITSSAAMALGTVIEAGNTDAGAIVAGTPSATGALTSSDIDHNATAAWSGSANGTYGSFAVGTNGQWSYTLDNSRTATQALREGQSVVETFTAVVTDDKGATAQQQVTITVVGTNDSPVAHADTAPNGVATPVTSDFLINTTIDGDQSQPTVTKLANGGYAVVWYQWVQTGFDYYGSGYSFRQSLQAQILDANGQKVGSQMELTGGNYSYGYYYYYNNTDLRPTTPTVTALASGGFAVAWSAYSDNSGQGIYSRAFDAAGSPATGALTVATPSGGSAYQPDVVALANGNYAVAWTSYNSGDGTDYDAVHVQIITPAGQKVGAEIVANTTTINQQYQPSITALADGGFAVTWNDQSGYNSGGMTWTDIRGQVFNASGAKVGAEFLVNTNTIADQSQPSIAQLATGGFVIVWQDQSSYYTGSSSQGEVRGQLFNASGTKVGTEFAVNATTVGDQNAPVVTALPGGGFVVAWSDNSAYYNSAYYNSGYSTNDYGNITAQVFDASGAKVGAEFTVNALVDGQQWNPQVSDAGNGSFLVSWISNNAAALGDYINNAIVGRIFQAGGLSNENSLTVANVVANDTDVDAGAVLTLSSVSIAPGRGSVSIVDNKLVFDPGTVFDHLAKGATDTVTVVYTITDEFGATSSSVATITVTGENDAPVALADTASGNEDAVISGTVTANDSDVDDGAALSYSLNAPVAGLTFSSNGSYSFNAANAAYQALAAGQQQTVVANYTVADGQGGSATSTLTITLTGTNDAPVVSGAVTGSATEDGASVTLNALAKASDVDSGTTLAIVDIGTLPAGVTYNAVAKTFTLNPAASAYQSLAAGQQTVVTVSYGVSDGIATTPASAVFTVTGTNDAPVVSGAVQGSATEDGASVTLSALANASDVDAAAVLSVVNIGSLPAGVSYDAAAKTFTLDPAASAYQSLAAGAQQVVTVNYSVSDGVASAPASASWTVTGTNDKPVAVADSNAATEDTVVTGSVAGNDSDVDGGAVLSYSLDAPIDGLTLNSNGTYSFDVGHSAYQALGAGETQNVVASYTVTDDKGGTATSALTITITGTNDAPVLHAQAAPVTDLDAAVATPGYDYQLGDYLFQGISPFQQAAILDERSGGSITRPDGSVFSLSALDLSASYITNPVTLKITGYIIGMAIGETVVTLDPNAPRTVVLPQGFSNVMKVTVEVIDNGHNHDTTVLLDNIILGNPGDRSVIAEHSNVTGDAAVDTGKLYLSFDEVDATDTIHATLGAPSVSWTGGTVLPNGLTSVLAQAVTTTVYGGGNGGNVELAFAAGDANFDFLSAGEKLTVTYDVTITDAAGLTSTQPATFTIVGTNDAPLTSDDLAAVTTGNYITVDVLANDVDPDHDGVLTLVDARVEPGQGYAWVENGQVAFDPDVDFASLAQGETSMVLVSYSVRDEHGEVSPASLWVTVTGTNDTPKVSADTSISHGEVIEAGALDGGLPVTTGTLVASDVDHGAVLAWTGSATGAYGSFAVDADGVWTYTLDNAKPETQALSQGQVVTETFTATVTDQFGAAATQTVTIQVTGALDNRAPTVVPVARSADEDAGQIVGPFFGSDPDGDAFTYQIVTGPAVGTVTYNFDGTFRYQYDNAFQNLAAGETATQTFTYQAVDSNGAASAPATVTITITGANDAPVITTAAALGNVVEAGHLDDGTVVPGTTTLSGTFASTDIDHGATSQWSFGPGAYTNTYGNLAVAADGSWTYTLDNSKTATQALAEGQTGTESYAIRVSDGQGGLADRTFTIQVTGTNDAPVAVADTIVGGSGTATALTNEILVNTNTASAQNAAAITALSNGGFVVSWTDNSLQGGDTSVSAVKAQLFTAAGGKSGSEFLVNTTTPSGQLASQVSALSNGNFVVSWTDNSVSAPDTSGAAVRAQIFTSAGAKVGSEFVVNTTTANTQSESSITGLTGGGFVVTWTDASLTGGDLSGNAVRAQLYNASGTKVGSEFLVNTTTTGSQLASNVTALASGGFVVTWTDGSATAPDTSGQAVRAQIFSSTGAKVGGEFVVNTIINGNQNQPSITSLASGGFAVAWTDASLTAPDTVGAAVRAAIFDAAGAKVGSDFLVNTTTSGNQTISSISAISGGGFMVAWQDTSLTGSDASGNAVRAQVFSATGTKVGTEFLVPLAFTANQDDAAITTLAGGNTAVVWTDGSLVGGDTSGTGIKLRLFSISQPTTENTVVTADVLANDTDVDAGKVLTLVSATAPSGHGTASVVGNKLVFNPGTDFDHLAQGATETVAISYAITDEKGATANSTATITVVGTNDVPVITSAASAATGVVIEAGYAADGTTTVGSATATGTLTSSDIDDGATATWSMVSSSIGTYGSLAMTTGGVWTYTLNNASAATQALDGGEVATDSFTVKVTDDKGGVTNQLVTVTVNGSNDLPSSSGVVTLANRLSNGGFDQTPDFTGWTTNLASTGTSSVSTSTAVINRTGSYLNGDTAVAVLNYAGQVPVGYGTGYGPSIKSNAFTANAGDTVTFTYQLDSGGDQAIGRAYIRDAVSGAIVQTVFNYQTPFTGSTGAQTLNVTLANSGSYTIDFQVGSYDATGGQAIGATMYIGFAGILSNGNAANLPFSYSNAPALLLANTTDPDGDILSISPFTTTSTHGALATLAADGVLTIDPRGSTDIQHLASGQTITDSFSFLASDGHGGTTQQTVQYTIAGVNDLPVITGGDTSGTAYASSGQTQVVSGTLGLADVDLTDAHSVSVSRVSGSQGSLQAYLVQDTTGTGVGQINWQYTTTATSTTTQTFTVTVSDGKGGVAAQQITIGGSTTAMASDAGNDTITATSAVDTLKGGAGNDVFVFQAGKANGDHILDFDGHGTAPGDVLQFQGYGAGASFTQVDATHWQVNYNGGASHEVITFDNAPAINAQDFAFI